MTYNQGVGQFGEAIARKYLIERGYEIIAQNIKAGFKEIDIIARTNNDLIFVEVKTRTSNIYGEADEAMFGKKIDNVRQAIHIYLQSGGIKFNYNEVRADLISVDINRQKKSAKIRHYKNIL